MKSSESQGSAATHFICEGIFNYCFMKKSAVKESWKSVSKLWRRHGQ